jgi:hypothetical protein
MHVKYGKEIDHKIPNNVRGNIYKSTKNQLGAKAKFFGLFDKINIKPTVRIYATIYSHNLIIIVTIIIIRITFYSM